MTSQNDSQPTDPAPPAPAPPAPRAHSEGAGESEPTATETPAAVNEAAVSDLSDDAAQKLFAILQARLDPKNSTATVAPGSAPSKEKVTDVEAETRKLLAEAKDPLAVPASKLPDYDGTDYWDPDKGWFAWVKKVRNAARNFTVTLNEPAILELGRRALVGEALDVWLDFHDEVETLEELGPHMMALMGETPLVDTMQKLVNLRFKGDLSEHEKAFRRYVSTITQENISNDRLAAILYGLSFGTSQEVVWKAVGDATKSFKQTLSAARMAKSELCQRYREDESKAEEKSASRWKRQRDSANEQGSTHKGGYKRRHAKDDDTRSPANSTPMGAIRCYNCQRFGHYATDCKEPKN